MGDKEHRKRMSGKVWIIIGSLLVMIAGAAAAGVMPGKWHCARSPEQALTRMDERVAALDLTAEQQAGYQAIRARVEARMNEGRGKHRQIWEEVTAELDKDNPDLPALVGRLKGEMNNIRGHIGEGMDWFLEFYNLLDESQQAQVMESIREHLDRAESFHARRMGRFQSRSAGAES